ncbi:pimeloyl-ACP methyl ester esterase BioH [Kangiella sediminilitoris]|uniref:Pimeloyl-[acyl-carrier protein] methyl ester esterase n=1 Tax=Kangiella sediminilitoris TaxID=1144748 RepID=A0A1B3B8R4_9GAMM|nr:pimeloyl-ACP methyl ester esterase BioH [Kangiella sediminilitoris]AOE49183.1 Pimeloyl-[acyl-carrier protein] methyl ester esterase [Kangiella sediminilitoris]
MSKLKPYVETLGKGPDLVLLHGWGLHSGIWELVTEQLAKDFTLHMIDLPGFGRSPLPGGQYDLDLLTEQVLKVAPEKANYLGWSLGGLVATQIAIQNPGRVESLITVSSSPRFVQSEDWEHAMKPNIMDSFCRYLEEDYQGTIIRFLAIQAIGSETQKADIKRLRDTVFLHGLPATKALREGLALLNDVDLRQDIKHIQVPFLRLYGRLDSLVPVKAAETIKQLVPQSEQHVFPKASHAPFLSHTDSFIEKVSEFLKA